MSHSHHSTSHRLLYVVSLIAILVVASGIVLMYLTTNARSESWQSVQLGNGQVYLGKVQGLVDDRIVLTSPYQLTLAKSTPKLASTTGDFLVEPIQNWYNIEPVVPGVQGTFTSEGWMIFDLREVLYWGPVDTRAEIVSVLNTLTTKK
jgi:hypothetical protein